MLSFLVSLSLLVFFLYVQCQMVQHGFCRVRLEVLILEDLLEHVDVFQPEMNNHV